jgi:ribosomal protein S12 methylthiotransferase accessory factor
MPAGARPQREGAAAIARALGVTRVARLTGLDRTGVEVASAIRPRAHVLQVTNGKGERPEDAATGALMEAAELFAAERGRADAWGSVEELERRNGPTAVSPRAIDPGGGEDGWDAIRLGWRAGTNLASGAPVLVPSHAVHVPPADGAPLGPALLRWTSNGMGAAGDRTAALLHALLEAIERDRVARALPEGFTKRELARRLVDPAKLQAAAPRTAALVRKVEARGLRTFLLDLSFPSPSPVLPRDRDRRRDRDRLWPLPTAAALILDVEGGPVPVAAGYATRLSRDAALRAALLEAAQSRATEIHGAREDVLVGDRHAGAALRPLLDGARAARDPARMPDVHAASARAAVRTILRVLQSAGLQPCAVDLEAPAGVAVVKVLVPGLLLSELL